MFMSLMGTYNKKITIANHLPHWQLLQSIGQLHLRLDSSALAGGTSKNSMELPQRDIKSWCTWSLESTCVLFAFLR